MATTALTIINRALRLCCVLDANEAAQAEDSEDALETLNVLLAEWHAADIGLPDYSFSSLGDAVASDAADRDALAYQLAERIAPEYGFELPPLAMKASSQAMNRLRLRYFQPGKTNYSELPSATTGSYNIETDS